MKLILASASPRRQQLIKRLGYLEVSVKVSSFAENLPKTINPIDYAVETAYYKARDIYEKTGGLVLGADTIVVIGDKILGKPSDKNEALEMFKMLCDKTHYVVTGICLMSIDKTIKKYEKTYVTFGAFNEKIVYNYIDKSSAYAGGYAIQDIELQPLIENVDGDIDNVIGLPVKLLDKTLKENF